MIGALAKFKGSVFKTVMRPGMFYGVETLSMAKMQQTEGWT